MLPAFSYKRIGWEPYLHLVWLVFLLFPPVFDPEAGAHSWALVGVIVALFLPLYFWTVAQCGRQRLAGLAGLCGLGLVFVPFNYGATSFFIYASAIAASTLRPRRAAQVIGGVIALYCVAVAVSGVPWPYTVLAFLPTFLMIILIGAMNMFYAAKARTDAKLRLAQDEIEHLATIAERERIARDLHDLLGHTLSLITLKSELAGKLLQKDTARAHREIGEVERISREALAEVRAAVSGYRARGFMEEVANAKLALEPAGISFAYRGDSAALSPLQESTLSLVLREAVTNVIRHAGATRCAAELHIDDEGVMLEIADNGRGLRGAPPGNGLDGIRERVNAVGGDLRLVSLQGTQLHIRLPGDVPVARSGALAS